MPLLKCFPFKLSSYLFFFYLHTDCNPCMLFQSHITRNCTPSLIFALKTIDVECRRGGQLVNHFGKSRHFTTKVCFTSRERAGLHDQGMFHIPGEGWSSRPRYVSHPGRGLVFTTKVCFTSRERASLHDQCMFNEQLCQV